VKLDASFNSLSRDHIKQNSCSIFLINNRLSTPSLGITYLPSELEAAVKRLAFNSLSRDHI